MDLLNSAMVQARIEMLETRNKELISLIGQEKDAYQNEKEIEKKEASVKRVEEYDLEFKNNEKEIAELGVKRDKMKELEKRMSFANRVSEESIVAKNESIYDSEEYRSAYAEYLKTGEKEVFSRAGFTTTVAAPVIPTILQDYIETAWEKYGNIARLCSQVNVKGYYSVPVEKSGSDAVVHAEGAAAPTESTVTLDSLLLKPSVIQDWITVTDEVKMLTGTDFLKYVGEHLIYKVFKKLNDLIINGTLSSGAGLLGILKDTTLVTSVTSTLTFNSVNTALAELVEFGNVTVALHPKTFFKNILGLADTTGQPIYTVATDNSGKPKYFISGLPVEFTESIPTYDEALTAKSTAWAVVGDFSAYQLNLPEGKDVSLLVDPYTLATEGKIRNIAKLGAAGRVKKDKRFAKLVTPAA